VFGFVIQGLYPAEEDIAAVQRGQATRPTGKPREIATMAWPPRPTAPKEDLPTDAKTTPASPVARARAVPAPDAGSGVRLAQRVSE
jgi:penicillin-binding protein 2